VGGVEGDTGSVPSDGWSVVDSYEILEDVSATDTPTSKEMTVPSDAINYAIMITPNNGSVQPYKVVLKEFKVDVKEPFTGYYLTAPELLNEFHLQYSDEYKGLVQDAQGYAALRYTINNPVQGDPMPVGIIQKGSAPVSVDPSVNQVPGSAAKGGEGAMVFSNDGKATISTQLALWNEQISATTVEFWWSTVNARGQLVALPDSANTFVVPAGAKGTLFNMHYVGEIESGTKLALRAKSDSIDGAFLQAVKGKPMLKTTIDFKELKVV
jgi:hypothetical protein